MRASVQSEALLVFEERIGRRDWPRYRSPWLGLAVRWDQSGSGTRILRAIYERDTTPLLQTAAMREAE